MEVRPAGEVRIEEVRPDESRPGETRPQEIRPEETGPKETRTHEMCPGEVRPGEARTEKLRPGEVRPGQVRPKEARKGEIHAGEARRKEARPGQVSPGEGPPESRGSASSRCSRRRRPREEPRPAPHRPSWDTFRNDNRSDGSPDAPGDTSWFNTRTQAPQVLPLGDRDGGLAAGRERDGAPIVSQLLSSEEAVARARLLAC